MGPLLWLTAMPERREPRQDPSPACLRAIGRLPLADTLVAFDFDGTLAPIVAEPARARMRPCTRRLLARLAARVRCAVITGRSLRSARRLLKGVPLALIIGSHGAEWPGEPLPVRLREQVRLWRAVLSRRLAPVAGLFFEVKPAALSIHYRRSSDPAAALRAIEAAVASLPGCRATRGLLVVNLAPARAPGKALALRRAARQLGCRHALFVGDDAGDEEAFAIPGLAVLGVRVGARGKTRAVQRLADQRGVDGLLRALLQGRGR